MMIRAVSQSLVVATILSLATVAAAEGAPVDTIYLKNGRTIQALDVRIEGDRLLFSQHGSTQAIPLSLVERVVEDDKAGAGEGSAADPAEGPDAPGAASPASGAKRGPTPLGPALGSVPPAERARMLSEMFSQSGGGSMGVDPSQALALLQMLGAGDGGGVGDAGLGALLGALGEGGGELGSLGADLGKVQTLLPALTRLGQALFAEEYSEEGTNAAVDELMQALTAAGVSQAEIDARLQGLGVPPGILKRQR